jgi:hypothetical protein
VGEKTSRVVLYNLPSGSARTLVGKRLRRTSRPAKLVDEGNTSFIALGRLPS